MRSLLPLDRPALLLAPMQDVTDLQFLGLMHRYGGADIYVTEYFRVYPNSRLDRHILRSIEENPTGRPIFAQMIGQEVADLVRSARELERYPVAGVDLNLGCPAPIVCRKCAGGGLLREPERVDEILGRLREAITGRFTVKTRIGFDDPAEFGRILAVFEKHQIDALTVHGRTVKEMYRTNVHYDRIRQAVDVMRARGIPTFANGNVLSVRLAQETIRETGGAGLMIGRGAIRNPWIFQQIREWHEHGEVQTQPTLRQLRAYIEELYETCCQGPGTDAKRVAKAKKYLNYIAQGIGSEGSRVFDGRIDGTGQSLPPEITDPFLYRIRRAKLPADFFAVCDEFLDRDGLFEPEPPAAALICTRSQRAEAAEREAARLG